MSTVSLLFPTLMLAIGPAPSAVPTRLEALPTCPGANRAPEEETRRAGWGTVPYCSEPVPRSMGEEPGGQGLLGITLHGSLHFDLNESGSGSWLKTWGFRSRADFPERVAHLKGGGQP